MPFKDPARKRDYQREWLARHPDKHREQSREGVKRWRKRHAEEHRAYRRNYYRQNSDRLAAQVAAWHRAHPEVRRLIHLRRRARERGAEGTFTVQQWLDLLATFGFRCGYCGVSARLQPDHRIPLFRGGTNSIENIIPSCPDCNLRKHVMTEDEFRRRVERDLQ